MTDEQTIYLSSEEELTNVRERLENAQAHKIILVIPSQTQLRSHVGWRLIYARMRELNKELLVISPDRQVRAVARAAGFRVAEPSEISGSRSGSTGHTRTVSSKSSGRSRVGGPPNRTLQSPASRPPTSQKLARRPAIQPPTTAPEPANLEIESSDEPLGRPERELGQSSQTLSPTFFEEPEVEEEHFGSLDKYYLSTTPSIGHTSPHLEENEDEDLRYDYNKDYNTAKEIRDAAREGSLEQASNVDEKESQIPESGKWAADPYNYMEDEQPPARLPEQKGSAPGPIEEIDTNAVDISDKSTEIMASEIEDLGDLGMIELPEIRSIRAGDAQAGQPRTQGERRSGQLPPSRISRHLPRAPRPGQELDEEDEELLQIPDRPTRGEEPGTLRPSRDLPGARRRASQPIAFGESRRVSQPIAPGQSRSTSQVLGARQSPSQPIALGPGVQAGPRNRPPSEASVQRSPIRSIGPSPGTRNQPEASAQRGQRGSRRGLVIGASILLLLLLGVSLFYFVPSATVTIVLRAKTFSHAIQLNATINAQASTEGLVSAQTLQNVFTVSGSGTATGSTRVGNSTAQGWVDFTNSGNIDLVIPSNIRIQTQSGIQFVTSAQFYISKHSIFAHVPITALQAGDNGNVSAGTITVIPNDSLTTIAKQMGIDPAVVNANTLTVTNAQATSGGGATTEPVVTTQDQTALAQNLHKQLQNKIQSWLQTQMQNGDVPGKPIPDVQGSRNPLPQEQLSGAPAVNQPVPSGTLSGTLTVDIKVLIVRRGDLQVAAGKQLDAFARKETRPETLASQLPLTLTHTQGTPSSDGNSLSIAATATGETITLFEAQKISGGLTTKGINQAVGELKTLTGAEDVKVVVFPAFLSFLPMRASQIHVVFQAVPVSG